MSDRGATTSNPSHQHGETPEPTGDSTHRLALRAKDAAPMLGISERHLWSLTNRGLIPHLRLGKAVIYPVAGLERWLAEEARKENGRL